MKIRFLPQFNGIYSWKEISSGASFQRNFDKMKIFHISYCYGQRLVLIVFYCMHFVEDPRLSNVSAQGK